MRIRYSLARRENFGDFEGVFKANGRGGTPLENRRAKRAAKMLICSSEKKVVPPCFNGGFEGGTLVSVNKVPPGFRQKSGVLTFRRPAI